MDKEIHNWKPKNWVRGTSRWFNLDKFISLRVDTNMNPVYNNTNNPQEWAIIGQLESSKEYFIKNYKKKENAYRWLGDVMEKQNG